ncbi:putative protein OS=Streptomyces fumanus OX=67302 GN=GCM10018772_61810 PE=4 SV=1 [Streptomyces fumanus]|uniref:Uncharacterized protein n=1 Tax=Streptomyces fumanus TaxID=67302 RepID=A0A919AX91_9ACTN|nr:hypothetical protein GCM10018772_61810 [Streptomyces fumanus]
MPPGDELRGEVRRFTDRFVTAMHTAHHREIFLKALNPDRHALGHQDLEDTDARWHHCDDPGSMPT